MRATIASAAPLLSALLWSAALIVDPGPWAPGSVFLIGLGMLVSASVALVGMTFTRGIWARRMAALALVPSIVIAVVRPVDLLWGLGLAVTALALIGLAVTRPGEASRRPSAAAGPPPTAVLLVSFLLLFPAVLGLAAWDEAGPGVLTVGVSAPMAGLWYARVLPGGLLIVRLAWPLLALAIAPTQPWIPALVLLAGALVVGLLAWRAPVKLAFHPPREVGSSFPIPPELAPTEVLDAARLDERGKPHG